MVVVVEAASKSLTFCWQGAESLAPVTRNNIWTSKSAPEPSVFNIWLGNVLRATTACTLSTSQLLNVLRSCHFLTLLTSKIASRHKRAQFFIAPLASWLRNRRFSEPTFWPSWATNHWENRLFRGFATFSHTYIFFLLTSSLLWSFLFFSSPLWLLPPLCFHLSMLSEVWLQNFLRLYMSEFHPLKLAFCAYTRFNSLRFVMFYT